MSCPALPSSLPTRSRCECPDCIEDSRRRAELDGHYWQRISEGPPPLLKCAYCGKTAHPLEPPTDPGRPSLNCKPDPWDSAIAKALSVRARNNLRKRDVPPTLEAVRAEYFRTGRRFAIAVMRWAGLEPSPGPVDTPLRTAAWNALAYLLLDRPPTGEAKRAELVHELIAALYPQGVPRATKHE